MSLLQYLTRYAEPESSCAPPDRRYRNVLVVPAFDEHPRMLAKMAPACGPRTLSIVVVNASEDRSADEKQRTLALHTHLADGARPLSLAGISLVSRGRAGDLLVIDRVSEGRRLPAKEGVGLARKIGCDLALAWHEQGAIESPWIHCTDADAALPTRYFDIADEFSPKSEVAALAYPFWHDCEVASTRGRALELYEMSLRYYVLGLAWAGSPYAFHCIGSTMALRASAYLAVRGIPKRQAGEDFYLLNKIAKIGTVQRPECAPLRLAQRDSQRTPFGTGPATAKINDWLLQGKAYEVYNPTSFALLREWIDAIDEFAATANTTIVETVSHPELRAALDRLGANGQLDDAAHQCKSAQARKKRMHDWFDGFRTLKLIHHLRDQGLSDRPWRDAFDAAPFVPVPGDDETMRQAMARRERVVLR